MYFRITIPALQDGKKDEAISFVKDKVMPEFDGTPGLISMTAAITGETSGINMSAYESKEASDAVAEKVQATLAEAASFMAAPPVIYEGEAVFGGTFWANNGLQESLNNSELLSGSKRLNELKKRLYSRLSVVKRKPDDHF